MLTYKRLFLILSLLFSIPFYTQLNKKDSTRGEFTYLLKAKLNTVSPTIHEEFFSLEIGNYHTLFVSKQSLKRDSIMEIVSKKANVDKTTVVYDLRGMSVPKTRFPYIIIQSNENVQYFQRVGMSILTYKEPIIKNWKLIDETKIINTIICKKAKVTFKGRNWIAWYSPEISLPYGPYKFSGLPGLIVKITDDKGDYDFELIKSIPASKLKGQILTKIIDKYKDAAETTPSKFDRALKVSRENADAMLASYGTTIIQGQEIIRQKQKEREINKKYENPIELERE